MKQIFMIVLVFSIPAMAFANTVTLEWEFPTNEECNISGFTIYMRADGGEYPDNPTASPAADERKTEITGLADGTFWFCIAATISIYDTESARSGEVGITFDNSEVSYPFSVTSPTILTIQGTVE